MKRRKTGLFITNSLTEEPYQAFVPLPLPPDPPLEFDGELQDLMNESLLSLGRLDGLTTVLPEPSLLLYMFIRKEAVVSSQIEGTQSSLSDLLLFESHEAPGVPIEDVAEVSSYVAAMNHGLQRLNEGFPLSNRLIREIHSVLLAKGRGSSQDPGNFRRSQVWIGGSRPGTARFVPPPHEHVGECMSALEKFLHDDPIKTPALIKAALSHVQFETIHPFLDGNGRLGRLLIALILCAERVLNEPMLYLSLYFKSHREDYYDLLQQVRTEGSWEDWIRFFLRGIIETSAQAVRTAKEVVQLVQSDRARLEQHPKATTSAMKVHTFLERNPISSIRRVGASLSLTVPTITSVFKLMEELQILRETTGWSRNRLYAYDKYIGILSEGAEPIRADRAGR